LKRKEKISRGLGSTIHFAVPLGILVGDTVVEEVDTGCILSGEVSMARRRLILVQYQLDSEV
jgi:hypothetical protein